MLVAIMTSYYLILLVWQTNLQYGTGYGALGANLRKISRLIC
jgi:hypothetical protein